MDWGYVYFVTDGEAMKIGYAMNLTKRIAGLQSANHFPLFLVGSVFAPRAHERMIQRRFRHLRIRGEWFRIHDDILTYIDTVAGWIDGDDMKDYEMRIALLNCT